MGLTQARTAKGSGDCRVVQVTVSADLFSFCDGRTCPGRAGGGWLYKGGAGALIKELIDDATLGQVEAETIDGPLGQGEIVCAGSADCTSGQFRGRGLAIPKPLPQARDLLPWVLGIGHRYSKVTAVQQRR